MVRFQPIVVHCHLRHAPVTYYPVRPVPSFFNNSERSSPSGRELFSFSRLNCILAQPDEVTRAIRMLNDASVVPELILLVRDNARCVQLLVLCV